MKQMYLKVKLWFPCGFVPSRRTWLTQLSAPSSSSCLLLCWPLLTTWLRLKLLQWWVFCLSCPPPTDNKTNLIIIIITTTILLLVFIWEIVTGFQHIYKPFYFPTHSQVFGFLVTCVYGANTFLAIRRWRLGSSCQGATQSSEYIRARTASRGEMEARPELVWGPAANQTDRLRERGTTGSYGPLISTPPALLSVPPATKYLSSSQ